MKVSNVCVEKVGDVVIAVIPGEELDASNIKEFKGSVEPMLESNNKVVFDLSELQFVDSSGCGMLLSCLRSMNASGGDLKLCSVNKPVRALFELIRMHHIFDILNTREEAVRAFRD